MCCILNMTSKLTKRIFGLIAHMCNWRQPFFRRPWDSSNIQTEYYLFPDFHWNENFYWRRFNLINNTTEYNNSVCKKKKKKKTVMFWYRLVSTFLQGKTVCTESVFSCLLKTLNIKNKLALMKYIYLGFLRQF